MFLPPSIPSRSLGTLAWWQYELLPWGLEVPRCSDTSMYHLIQCMYFHIFGPAHAVPEQHPFPKALVMLISPAWIWSSSPQGPDCWVAHWSWSGLDSHHSPPKAPVCLTVLLPSWIQCNSYHVPLQQWSWLAWRFLQKL